VSVEQVAALASQNTLPEPSLHLDSLPSSTTNAAALQFARQNPTRDTSNRSAPYNQEDPWGAVRAVLDATGPLETPFSGGPSVVAGSGLPGGWWKNQSKVQVNLLGLQGFILNRYIVYEVVSDVSPVVEQTWIFSLLTCVYACSVVLLSVDGTPSLLSCGIASSGGTLSDCCLPFPQNGSDVSPILSSI